MSGGKAEARSRSNNAVVVTGGSGFGGAADEGPGGGADRGGGGDRQDGKCDRQLIKWGGYCSKHDLRYRS